MTDKEKEIVYLQPSYPCPPEEDEIDLLDLWRTIWNGKWLIIGLTSLLVLVAGVIAFKVLPVTYQSSATLAPIKRDNSLSGGLSSLVGSLPIPISLPGSRNQTSIMAFLQSRTLKERLITKNNLLPILYKDIWNENTKQWKVDVPKDIPTVIKAIQEQRLDALYSVSQDKTSELITIAWETENPPFAADMLQRVIGELQFFLDNEYVTDAKRERIFVEGQLEAATRELERWEMQVPSERLTLAKITRERLAAETVYTELRKQLELSKISEAKENITFKVLDPPFVPEKKYKPKRSLIIALAGVTGLFLSVFIVFIRQAVRNRRAADNGATTPPRS
ncbi:MAG: Wzz/FepE/Etk N-terminal domain-containing protein [Thermodesulfobacteriota bacterium]